MLVSLVQLHLPTRSINSLSMARLALPFCQTKRWMLQLAGVLARSLATELENTTKPTLGVAYFGRTSTACQLFCFTYQAYKPGGIFISASETTERNVRLWQSQKLCLAQTFTMHQRELRWRSSACALRAAVHARTLGLASSLFRFTSFRSELTERFFVQSWENLARVWALDNPTRTLRAQSADHSMVSCSEANEKP